MFDQLNYLLPEIRYFVDRRCLPSWNLPEGRIDFHDLTFVYAGEATYIINNITFKLKVGDLLYAPIGSTRKAFTNPQNPMCCFAFNFYCRYSEYEYTKLPLPAVSSLTHDSDLLDLYTKFNVVWLERKDGYVLKANGLFMLILHRIITLCNARDINGNIAGKRLKVVIDYIMSHYNENISIRAISDMLNLNPVYLGAYFKKNTGYSMKEYINRIRVQKASDLLSTGGFTVSEAAFHCGFDDIYYFSKVFKRIVGVPPSKLL